MEREIIRERIKLGLERVRSQGKHIGRKFGSKDLKPRRKEGYLKRWADERNE